MALATIRQLSAGNRIKCVPESKHPSHSSSAEQNKLNESLVRDKGERWVGQYLNTQPMLLTVEVLGSSKYGCHHSSWASYPTLAKVSSQWKEGQLQSQGQSNIEQSLVSLSDLASYQLILLESCYTTLWAVRPLTHIYNVHAAHTSIHAYMYTHTTHTAHTCTHRHMYTQKTYTYIHTTQIYTCIHTQHIPCT